MDLSHILAGMLQRRLRRLLCGRLLRVRRRVVLWGGTRRYLDVQIVIGVVDLLCCASAENREHCYPQTQSLPRGRVLIDEVFYSLEEGGGTRQSAS